MNKKSTFLKNKSINCNGTLLDLKNPVVMGILNITPDSFYDGGKNNNIVSAIKQAEKMIGEGAEIIDIGAISTRPYSDNISEKEEIIRLLPTLKILRRSFAKTILSVDTYRAEVAKIALEEGANIINDISAGSFDEEMLKIIVQKKAPYVAMHIKGTPDSMQLNPQYNDVVEEVMSFFAEKLNYFRQIGLSDVIIDPGFGFGKTVEHNYKLLKNLDLFSIHDAPILVGLSRKSFINKVLNIKPENALNGTTALNTIALLKGADILRVHDVKEAKEIIELIKVYEIN